MFKLIKDITWDVAFHCSAREMAIVCKLLQKTKSTYDILRELKGFVPAGREIDTVHRRIQVYSHSVMWISLKDLLQTFASCLTQK